MIGRDLLEPKAIDGKPFVKERVELAKSMFRERLDETVLRGGVCMP